MKKLFFLAITISIATLSCKKKQLNPTNEQPDVGVKYWKDQNRLVFSDTKSYYEFLDNSQSSSTEELITWCNELQFNSYLTSNIDSDGTDMDSLIPYKPVKAVMNPDLIVQVGDWLLKTIPNSNQLGVLHVAYIDQYYNDLKNANFTNQNSITENEIPSSGMDLDKILVADARESVWDILGDETHVSKRINRNGADYFSFTENKLFDKQGNVTALNGGQIHMYRTKCTLSYSHDGNYFVLVAKAQIQNRIGASRWTDKYYITGQSKNTVCNSTKYGSLSCAIQQISYNGMDYYNNNTSFSAGSLNGFPAKPCSDNCNTNQVGSIWRAEKQTFSETIIYSNSVIPLKKSSNNINVSFSGMLDDQNTGTFIYTPNYCSFSKPNF